MRALLETVSKPAEASFTCMEFSSPRFTAPWHFHPECELTLIRESDGRRFVGDHIGHFAPGDLVLLGPELPHFWHNDPAIAGPASAVVAQFHVDFLGPDFLKRGELRPICNLLVKARRGLQITGSTQKKLIPAIGELPRLSGLSRLLNLLGILDDIAHAPGRDVRPLSSAGFVPLLDPLDAPRINKVLDYINRNFSAPLSQPIAARLANLTPSAFSRFFKRRTGKSFSAFVNEVRVGHACKLLQETELNITEICFASGFENLSNFNRRFRELKQVTPSVYRKLGV